MSLSCPFEDPSNPIPAEREALRERAIAMARSGELKFLGFNDGLLQGHELWPDDYFGHKNEPSIIDIDDPIYQVRNCRWNAQTGVTLLLALDQMLLLERIDRVIEVDNSLSGTVEVIRKAQKNNIDPELAARVSEKDSAHEFKVDISNKVFWFLCILTVTSIGIVVLDGIFNMRFKESVITAFSVSIPIEIIGVLGTFVYSVTGKNRDG